MPDELFALISVLWDYNVDETLRILILDGTQKSSKLIKAGGIVDDICGYHSIDCGSGLWVENCLPSRLIAPIDQFDT